MEKAAHGVRTSDQCDGARIHDEVGVDSPREAKTTADVSSAIQMLESTRSTKTISTTMS